MHMLHIKNYTIVHQYNKFWDYFMKIAIKKVYIY